jgi:hypothetical protein
LFELMALTRQACRIGGVDWWHSKLPAQLSFSAPSCSTVVNHPLLSD